jgi:hypothetical protein
MKTQNALPSFLTRSEFNLEKTKQKPKAVELHWTTSKDPNRSERIVRALRLFMLSAHADPSVDKKVDQKDSNCFD